MQAAGQTLLLSRRAVLAAAGGGLAAIAAGRGAEPVKPAFAERGYYLTFMRMPTYGLEQWERAIDLFASDGANLLILWMAGGFRSKKFPVTWRYNQEHRNVREDFGRKLITYAQSKGVRVLLGFTPFGYDGTNQYPIERPELKATGKDGEPTPRWGIHSWGWNLCPSQAESHRFMLEYAREMYFDFYPGADGLLVESSDYAICHCGSCRGRFFEKEFEFVRAISEEVWARKPEATVLVYPHYFSGAKVPGFDVTAARQEFDRRWSLFFTPHSAPPHEGLIKQARSSMWSDDAPALRDPAAVRANARRARDLGVSGYVPSLEGFSYVASEAEEGQQYLVGQRQVPFGMGWMGAERMPFGELPVRVNRIAYREFSRDPGLTMEEFKARLRRQVLGAEGSAQDVEDLLDIHGVFFKGRTWCQGAPLASPQRVRAMKEQGKLKGEEVAAYRATLARVREIAARHDGATSEGGRELRRISEWVLGQWSGENAGLLAER